MTIQPTEAPAVDAGETSLRTAMMRAFAVAETVTAQLHDDPTTVTVQTNYDGTYSVDVYFHNHPDYVARFGADFDVPVSTTHNYGPQNGTYTSAQATVNGVKVRGWALMNVQVAA
ncbi:hypothetical protein [Streptomyces xantholiticus]|uniref:hypothetical protein n=1 Tax=Streptomyces xantholiticus TaxID=68285 RepID=UPI001678B1B4|nr:hypothetical protein [Streptomyces xantholiticus]GGW41071.1 hypothetical protein GCM10010381_27370 [Streptomyces xantholiticus]